MTQQMIALARFLFERQARTYAEEPLLDEVWHRNEGVREFWLSEAEAILEFLYAPLDLS